MGARGRFPSDSQRDLAKCLVSHGKVVRDRLEGKVHRTALWRYATAKSRPGSDAIAQIEEETKDLTIPVVAHGWGRSAGRVTGGRAA